MPITYNDNIISERYLRAKKVPVIITYIGRRAEQLIIGMISIVMRRERLLSMVLVAITAGTLHPNPIIRGMNDLP